MRIATESVRVAPKRRSESCVIWLHGLGADGYDFADVVPSLGLPKNHAVEFIFPHAPLRPVTLNQGMVMPAWYDIAAISPQAPEDEPGIRAAQRDLFSLIEGCIEEGIPTRHIVLVGFSQGGAVALHTALRFGHPLAGVAGLSTYLPLRTRLKEELQDCQRALPIFLAHGLVDSIVPYALAEGSLGYLEAVGLQPSWHVYPTMSHTVCLEELSDLGVWIQQVLTL